MKKVLAALLVGVSGAWADPVDDALLNWAKSGSADGAAVEAILNGIDITRQDLEHAVLQRIEAAGAQYKGGAPAFKDMVLDRLDRARFDKVDRALQQVLAEFGDDMDAVIRTGSSGIRHMNLAGKSGDLTGYRLLFSDDDISFVGKKAVDAARRFNELLAQGGLERLKVKGFDLLALKNVRSIDLIALNLMETEKFLGEAGLGSIKVEMLGKGAVIAKKTSQGMAKTAESLKSYIEAIKGSLLADMMDERLAREAVRKFGSLTMVASCERQVVEAHAGWHNLTAAEKAKYVLRERMALQESGALEKLAGMDAAKATEEINRIRAIKARGVLTPEEAEWLLKLRQENLRLAFEELPLKLDPVIFRGEVAAGRLLDQPGVRKHMDELITGWSLLKAHPDLLPEEQMLASLRKMAGGNRNMYKIFYTSYMQSQDLVEMMDDWVRKGGTRQGFLDLIINTERELARRQALFAERALRLGAAGRQAEAKALQELENISNTEKGMQYMAQLWKNPAARKFLIASAATVGGGAVLYKMYDSWQKGTVMEDLSSAAFTILDVVPGVNALKMAAVEGVTKEVVFSFVKEALYFTPAMPYVLAGDLIKVAYDITGAMQVESYHCGLVEILVYNSKFEDGKWQHLDLPDKRIIPREGLYDFFFATTAVRLHSASESLDYWATGLKDKTYEVFDTYYLPNDTVLQAIADGARQQLAEINSHQAWSAASGLDLFGAGVGFLKWMADYEGVCGGSASNENWCKVFLLLTRQMEARKDYVAKNIMIPQLIALAEEMWTSMDATNTIPAGLAEVQRKLEVLRGSSLGVDLVAVTSNRARQAVEESGAGTRQEKRVVAGDCWKKALAAYTQILQNALTIRPYVARQTGYDRLRLLQFTWTGDPAEDQRKAAQSKQGFADETGKIRRAIAGIKGKAVDPFDAVDREAFRIMGDVVYNWRVGLDAIDKAGPEDDPRYQEEYKAALEAVRELYRKNANFQDQVNKGAKLVPKGGLKLDQTTELSVQITDADLRKDFEAGRITLSWASSPQGNFYFPDNKRLTTLFTPFRPEPCVMAVHWQRSGATPAQATLKLTLPVAVPEDFLKLTLSTATPQPAQFFRAEADIPERFYGESGTFRYTWSSENCALTENEDRTSVTLTAPTSGAGTVTVELWVRGPDDQYASLAKKTARFMVAPALSVKLGALPAFLAENQPLNVSIMEPADVAAGVSSGQYTCRWAIAYNNAAWSDWQAGAAASPFTAAAAQHAGHTFKVKVHVKDRRGQEAEAVSSLIKVLARTAQGLVRIEGPATARPGEEITLKAVIEPAAGIPMEAVRHEWKNAEKKPGGLATFKKNDAGDYTVHLDVYVLRMGQERLEASADHAIKVVAAAIDLTSPADGLETPERLVPVTFTMIGYENAAKVEIVVNGVPSEKVPAASHSEKMPLTALENTIQVVATMKDGSVVRSKTVRVKWTKASEKRFAFQLRWTRADTDIDLHLNAPDGGHCWYSNQHPDFADLEKDVVERDGGRGPEDMTLNLFARPGKYTLSVEYYSTIAEGTPPSDTATITLLDGSKILKTWTKSLTSVKQHETVWTFNLGVALKIQPPPKTRVVIGEKMALEVKLVPPEGENFFGSAAPAGKMKFLWVGENDVQFEPAEETKGQTVARFTRPGRTRIHVRGLVQEGESQKQVGESEAVEIEVVPPSLTLEFQPQDPYVGQEVMAKVIAEPPMPEDALRFQWFIDGPTVRSGAKEAGAYVWEYTFTPKKPEPIKVTAKAITTEGDEDAGEAVKTCTAKLYDVKAVVTRAVFSPTPQATFDPNRRGPSTAAARTDFNTDEHVGLEASIAPAPEGDVRWRWTANEGTTLIGDISRTPSAYRHEAGTATLTVSARNGDDVVLGTGTVSFAVVDGPTGPGSAGRKMAEARKAWAAGEIDKAVALAGEAQAANTKDAAIGREADQMRRDRDAIKAAVRDGEGFLAQKKLADAEKKANEAIGLNGKYPPSVALLGKIAQARKDMVDAWQREIQKAQGQYNAGDFAGAQATLAPVLKGIQESAGIAPPALAGQVQDLQKKIEAAIAQLKKVMAKSAEITGLLGQKKLQTAIQGQNELATLAGGLPGDGAKRIKDESAGKIAAAQQQYNAFIGQKDQAHKAAADKLDWKAAKQAAEGKREWELAPPDDTKLKEQVATAERKIKEQDDALKAADAAEQQAGSGPAPYFLGGQADQAIQDLKQKQQLFGSWDPRRARFDQAIRKLEDRKKGEGLWEQAKNLYNNEFPKVQDPYDTALLERILGICRESLGLAPVETRRGFLSTLEALIRERKEKAAKKQEADRLWKQAKDLLENNGDMKTVESLCTQSVQVDPAPSEARRNWLTSLTRANQLWLAGKALIEPPKDLEGGLAKCKESISLASNKPRRDFVAGLEQRRAQAQERRREGARIEQGGKIPDLQKALEKYRESLRLWPNPELEAYIRNLQAKLDRMIAEVARSRARKYIFDNYNKDGVFQGSVRAPSFTIQSPQMVEFICTYHWMNGRGAQPGTIGLRDQGGRVYGPWDAQDDADLGGKPNVNWIAFPGVTIPAGTYTVMDSDTATWSYNYLQNAGFARVGGFAQPAAVSKECILGVAMSGCGAGATAVDANGVEHSYTFFQSSVTATVGVAQQVRITVTMGDGTQKKAEGTGRAALTMLIPPNTKYTVHIQNLTATGHCESVQSFETDEQGRPQEVGAVEKPKPPEWVKKVTAADFVGRYTYTDPSRSAEAFHGEMVFNPDGTGNAQEFQNGGLTGKEDDQPGLNVTWQFKPEQNVFVLSWRTRPDRQDWGHWEAQISGYSPEDFTITGVFAGGKQGQMRFRRHAGTVTEPTRENLAYVKGFAGKWTSNWGDMEFTVNGTKVIGHYTHDQGRIEATLSPDGKTMVGVWLESPSYKPPNDGGKVTFELLPDGDHIKGRWGYGDNLDGGDWTGTRIREADPAPSSAASSIAEFVYVGKDADKVGTWNASQPDGQPDGHFRLRLSGLGPNAEVRSMNVYVCDASGNRGGSFWRTEASSSWILGAFVNGTFLNPGRQIPLGRYSGHAVFDLYASDNGTHAIGNYFIIEVDIGGDKLTKITRIGQATPSQGQPSSSGILGTWKINANNYTGRLEFTGAAGALTGRVFYDAHGNWENLEDLSYNPATGELRFLRPISAMQHYKGTWRGNGFEGEFDSSGTPGYKWKAWR